MLYCTGLSRRLLPVLLKPIALARPVLPPHRLLAVLPPLVLAPLLVIRFLLFALGHCALGAVGNLIELLTDGVCAAGRMRMLRLALALRATLPFATTAETVARSLVRVAVLEREIVLVLIM